MRSWLFMIVVGGLLIGLFLIFRLQRFQTQDVPTPPAVSLRSDSTHSLDQQNAPMGSASSPAPIISKAMTEGAAGQARSPAEVSPREFDVRVLHGKREAGPSVIKLMQGETVTLRVTSDVSDDLHLHGYDLHLHLKPNEAAALTFVADRTGRFTYELHHARLELGALEVYPR